MFRRLFFLLVSISAVLPTVSAIVPTDYPWIDCQGSARPYPVPAVPAEYPDSLTPVMINHVGRHGARFPATPSHVTVLGRALDNAQRLGTVTPLGMRLKSLVEQVERLSAGRWGALDSLGAAEQRGIAARMYAGFPEVFEAGRVMAQSSYVPRCVMSMYEFLHEITCRDRKIDITAVSGPQASPLMRFFEDNKDYRDVVKRGAVPDEIEKFTAANVTMEPLRRVLGRDYPFGTDSAAVAMAEYSVLAGLSAMGLDEDVAVFLTPSEQNRLWSIFNLRQYLTRTATTLSAVPADIAAPLLENLITTTDAFIRGDRSVAPVMLRFGHAETLMPLLSLMRLPGCFYLTNRFETVARGWTDFTVVPMAANLQLILFRSETGRYYLRVDLNEKPVALRSGYGDLYTPWNVARVYLSERLPLY